MGTTKKNPMARRALAVLLLVVLIFGMVPPAFAVETLPSGTPPAKITLKERTYSGQSFTTPELGKARNRTLVADAGGIDVPMFCADHTKNLNTQPGAITWANPISIDEYEDGQYKVVKPFINAYYSMYYNNKYIDEAYPDLPEGNGEEAASVPYKTKMDAAKDLFDEWYNNSWSKVLYSSYAQCAIWLAGFNLFTDLNDEAQLRMLARNVQYAYHSMYAPAEVTDEAIQERYQIIKNIIRNYNDGVYADKSYIKGEWDFYIYSPTNGSNQQTMLLANPKTPPQDPQEGYLTLLKQDDKGQPLAGAEFSVYTDSACTNLATGETSGTTESDGKLTLKVTWDGSTTKTFYVKETKAPTGYFPSSTIYAVLVNSTVNNESNPAPVNGGTGIPNGTEPDDPGPGTPTGVLRKIDAVTGYGIGPATFTFYGSNSGGAGTFEFTTDSSGSLNLQWSNPLGDNYIAPGTYTVREKQAPLGYAMSNETQQITFNSDGRTSTGPLVFRNEPYHIIRVHKVDGEGAALANVTFDVFKNGTKVGSVTTDASGDAIYAGPYNKGVDTGLYGFYEIEAPTGYLLPHARYQEVFVNTDDPEAAVSDRSSYTHVLTFVNYDEPEIVIQKLDSMTLTGVSGAVFDLLIDGRKVGTYGPTGGNGQLVITPAIYRGHLDPSKDSWTFTVQEVSAPSGYLLDDPTIQTLEVAKGQAKAQFTFKDTPYPEIVITKYDSESGRRLEGGVYHIVISGGFDVTRTTNGAGEIRITYDEYAEFIGVAPHDNLVSVTEVKAPDGYNRDGQTENADSYTISKNLSVGTAKIDFEFRDTEYRDIRVLKKDSQTGWLLSDASFTLQSIALDAGGTYSRTLTTDGTGAVLFENVPNGTYDLYESKAPNGYANNAEHQTIVVKSSDAPITEYVRENAPKSGLLIRKLDSVTLQPIPSVQIRVERLAGDSVVETWEKWTDSNGVIVMEDISEGWYRIQEIAAADGYVLNSEPKTQYVSNQHDAYVVTLLNNQTNMLNVIKKDAVTGAHLAGVVYEVRTAGGSHVANITTGINGYANLAGLKPGSYVVEEISVPAGHILDPYPKTFEVTDDDAGRVWTLIFENSPTIKIYLVKHDNQTNAPVEGAEYTVSASNGTVIADHVKTDENGIAMVTDDHLGEGTYYIKEVRAPAGYLKDETQYSVFVHDDEVKTVDLYDDKPGGIRLLKVDLETNAPLEGAQFALYTLEYKYLDTFTTDAEGYIRIDNLIPGYYYLKETKAPAGYQLDDEYRRVEVKAFEVTDTIWTNSQLSSLTIRKIDLETALPLSSAEFEIRAMDGTLMKTLKTDASGIASVSKFPDGYYVVTEVKPPKGYLISEDQKIVKITANQPATVVFEDQELKGAIVTKVDADEFLPLSGAVIELRSLANDLLGTYTTDGSGTFTTKLLEPGFYYLVETRAPEGYVLDSTPVMFEAKAGIVPSVTLQNRKQSSIGIFKADAVTGNPLGNAEYTVKDLSGNVVEVITTDNSGWAYTTKREPGRYFISETKAPAGYAIDETVHEAVVEAGKQVILRLTDVPETVLQIVKVDKNTRAELAGAVFELYQDTGHGDCTYIGTYTTGDNGRIVTEPLSPGFYLIKEVKAPAGYALDASFSSRSYGGIANVKTANNEYRYCLTAGETNEVVVEDSELAVLTIRKIDSVTGKALPSAVFKVETADHSLVGMFESDANGEAILTGVQCGTYIVTETQAPPGYSIAAAPITIVVEYGKNNYVDFKDAENGSLLIDLRDKVSGIYLAGGKFTVMRCSDNTIIYESATDDAGSIVVESILPGKYIITQTFAPDGYYITESQQTILIPAGTQQTVHFYNVTAGIVIEAVNSQTKTTLEGVRFQLTRNEDNIVIGEFITQNGGLALASGLKPGMYTVEVLAAPSGFSIDNSYAIVHIKETGEAHVTFTFTPHAGITVRVVEKTTKAVISGAVIEIWAQNGEMVNSYVTDGTGTIMTDALAPGFYVLHLVHVEGGYAAEITEATVEIRNGVPVTYTFEVTASGSLNIISKDQNGKAIPGMKVSVTTISGSFVGEYTTGDNGMAIVSGLAPGYYVIHENEAPDGFNIVFETRRAEVLSNQAAEVVFTHTQTVGLQIRTLVQQTNELLPGAVYRITNLDGSLVGSYTSGADGLAFISLKPGTYVVTLVSAPSGYALEGEATRNVTVLANEITIETYIVKQLSGIHVRVVDGASGAGIYNVRILLMNGSSCIKEYYTDNEGYISLEALLLDGGYTLEMVSAPDGYTVDKIRKSVDILNGETTEVLWAIYKEAGQIQVVIRSSDYNAARDLPAGTLLQGAIFEVMNADTYQVMCRMVSDSYGVAASSGLPIGRYIVKQLGAAPYYALVEKETEVRLKVNNDIVRIEFENPSVNVKTTIAQKTNKTVKAGSSMRVDIVTAANASDVRLDNFFLHIKVPTDAARISTLSTGTWNQAVWYSIRYKTNMNDYRLLSDKLLSTSKYQYDLSTAALGLQLGEYVTDVRFEFGTVPAGFSVVNKPAYLLYVLNTVANGYKLAPRAELGGQYNTVVLTTNGNVGTATGTTSAGTSFTGTEMSGTSGQWSTDANIWSTNVTNTSYQGTQLPSRLPKTGY